MFTGLVQAVGTIAGLGDDGHRRRPPRVAEPNLAPAVAPGEGIPSKRACLAVRDRDAGSLRFQAGPETLHRTNLGQLAAGDPVNLERALRLGDHLGGHFVTGHVDAVGTIAERASSGEWETVWFSCPNELDALMVAKG